jgi:hypothetical protein
MIEQEITIPIFNYGVKILYGDTNDIADKLEEYHEGLSCGNERTNKGTYLVVTNKKDGIQYDYMIISDDSDESTIYHESLHLAWEVLDRIDIEISPDNHEILAYLQEYIAKEVINIIKNK